MTDKRKFQRVPFQCHSQIKLASRTCPAELLDISMKGALFLIRDLCAVEMGQTCLLDIRLVNSDIHLQFEARLVHREGEHFGFVFISEDIDTFTHLRRLLELNLGDSELVDRELGAWIKG